MNWEKRVRFRFDKFLDDVKTRLIYVEKEFEQLKEDYYQLNMKQKELLSSFNNLENENRNLLETIDQLNDEKRTLKQLNEQQEEDLVNAARLAEQNQIEFKENLDSLQNRISNYENAVSQYEEYRVKLETNLDKITQQRDTNKMELRLAREMLTNKENEFNQMKNQLESIRIGKERTQSNVEQLEKEIRDLKSARTKESQNNEKQIQVWTKRTFSTFQIHFFSQSNLSRSSSFLRKAQRGFPGELFAFRILTVTTRLIFFSLMIRRRFAQIN